MGSSGVVLYANIKGADQTAHVRSQINAFPVHSPEIIVVKLPASNIESVQLVNIACS